MNHDTWLERTTQHLMNEEDRQLIRVFTELAWNESRRNMWISVEERLPKLERDGVIFNIRYEFDGVEYTNTGYYNSVSDTWFDSSHETVKVRYWAPLPGDPE